MTRPGRFATARRIASSRPGSGRLTVLQDGETVLDHVWGPAEGDRHWVFSASKPLVAVLVHQLVDDGLVALDDPVATHWPEFAAHGKENITLRDVLTHRAGLPAAAPRWRGGAARDSLRMTDWEASTRAAALARPRSASRPAYGYLTFGFVLGEVVSRLRGAPFAEVARERIFEPLGMRDSSFGVEVGPRDVPLTGVGPAARIVARTVNRPEVRRAVIPAGGLSTTTRDLARFYETLRRGGELDGTRLLSSAALAELVRPSDRGQIDAFVHLNVRYGQGVQLGGPRDDLLGWGPFGRTSSPRAFGHNGSNVAIAWTDPSRRLTYVHATGVQTTYLRDFSHLARVADAVLEEA